MATDAPAAEVGVGRVGEASDEAPGLGTGHAASSVPRYAWGTRGPHSAGARQAWGGAQRIPAVSPRSEFCSQSPLLLPGVKAQQVFGASDPAQGRHPRVLKVAGSLTAVIGFYDPQVLLLGPRTNEKT